MTPMRQRLLLVAGWLLAAIGAGVVASAAVAVAGGQVMDRPLSPLTAAEVAALPVVGTERTQEQIERLASGASDPTDRAPADERERATATGSTGIGSPAGDGGASAADSIVENAENGETDGESRVDTADPEAFSVASSDVESVKESRIIGSDVATIHVPGGSASVADLGDHLSLLWATPRPQYVVGLRFDSPTNLTLTFTSTLRRYVIDVGLDEDGILVTNDLVAIEESERDGQVPLG